MGSLKFLQKLKFAQAVQCSEIILFRIGLAGVFRIVGNLLRQVFAVLVGDKAQSHVHAFQSTPLPKLLAQPKAFLLDVAECPSKQPAAASNAEPVQTDRHHFASRTRAASICKNALSDTSVRVPMPPGTSKTEPAGNGGQASVSITKPAPLRILPPFGDT